MANYIIGDIHGCFKELTQLLDLVNFDSNKDKLFFTGDMVNGAPNSVATLQFIKDLGDNAVCILGNHDLTLLALGKQQLQDKISSSGFNEVLNNPNKKELLDWLITRPLVHFDSEFNFLLIHAGLYPLWGVEQVCALAEEVHGILSSENSDKLLGNMFGNLPDKWDDNLHGWERIRFIINACTRMRFCSPDGRLELITKGDASSGPSGFLPWYNVINRKISSGLKIIFGHWSALVGVTNKNNIVALDTGCMWGNSLTAFRLEDEKRFAVSCPQYCSY